MTSSTVKRAYKFRFYPDEQQRDLLLRTFGCCRLVWNRMLQTRTEAWHQEGRSIGFPESSAILTQWKKSLDLEFLNEVSSVPLQQTLRHLQGAFSRFWNKQNQYPRFKSRKASRKSAEFTRSAFTYVGGSSSEAPVLRLAKCDQPLDVRWSRSLPVGAEPSTVTVSQDAAGRWYVSLLVEEAVEHHDPSSSSVGIDMGLKDLAVLNTGERIKNPRHSRKQAARLARAQRELARRQGPRRGSAGVPAQRASQNYLKTQRKIARIHAETADRRRDHLHKISSRIVHENQVIVIEDLQVASMSASGGSRKRGLNRSIQDASWAQLRSMLEYKAPWYGRELVVIDRWFPSTQLCSSCSRQTGPRGDLGVRSWTCSACGISHDRDVNAAKNILAAGLAVSVCGDGRSLRHAHS